MNSVKKKNFRAFLFDQSVSPEILSPKKNLFRQSQKLSSSKNSKIEYSKTKDSKYESSNTKVKNIQTILPSNIKSLNINNRYEYTKENQFPKINNFTMTNTIDSKIYNNLYFSNYKSKLNRKSNKLKYKLSIKKSLFNSFDYEAMRRNKRVNNPKYIRLSKVFNKIPLDNDMSKFNTMKSNLKDKEYKLKILNIEEYNKYIINKLKINYNKNFDSSFIHNLKSDFLVDFVEKKNQYILKSAKQYESENSNGEFELEEKDKVDDKNLGKVKLSEKIRKYLINRFQKNFVGKEAINFYSNKENLINFLYDINLLPTFKNNLVKQTYDSNKLNILNYINHSTIRNLNIAKIKIQKNKDIRNTFEFIREQIGEEKIDLSKIELDKNYTDKYDLFEMEDYLTKKKLNQSKVKLFNEKEKFYFYNTFMKLHDKKLAKAISNN